MRGVRHLLALGTAAVCGVLLYCLRLRFPNPLTEALGPANASPWETGKLVFWAMLPAAAVLRRLEGSGGAGLCAAILLGAGLGLALAATGAAPAAAALLAAAMALGVHALALGRLGGRHPAVVRRGDPAGGGVSPVQHPAAHGTAVRGAGRCAHRLYPLLTARRAKKVPCTSVQGTFLWGCSISAR